MTMSPRLLLATGFAGLMSLTLLAPTVFAQDVGAPADAPPMAQADDNGGQRPAGARGERRGEHRAEHRADKRGGIAGLICSTDGATRLETRLGDLATQLKLTNEQQPLFDDYKAAALTAQTSFAEACAMVQPAATGTGPDALTMMKNRQIRQTASLEALNAVLPSFEALYDSLDDTQKAALLPLAGQHRGLRGDDRGDDRASRRDDRGDERGRGKGRHDGRHSMIDLSTEPTSAVTAG
jgi:hypothetical protein